MKLLISMKFMLCAACIIGSVGSAFSQTKIALCHNSMRIGDVVKWYKVATGDIWNLSKAEIDEDAVSESFEDFKTDTITSLFKRMRKYYLLSSDSLLYVGSESPLQKDSCYISEIYSIFPMSLSFENTGCFAAHVSYCDKMRFHKYGTYTVKADSIGTLILPDGDSISNVLQICHTRQYQYDKMDTVAWADMPKYDEEEIHQKLAANTGLYTEIETALYAKGYRYPIVSDYKLYDAEHKPLNRETYYCPPFEQEAIPLDEANIQVRRDNNKTDNNNDDKAENDPLPYIRQIPGSMEIAFDAEKYIAANPLGSVAQCNMIISDIRGIVYRERHFSMDSHTGNDVRLSYSGLSHGQYVISIILDNQKYTKNFYIE